MLASAGREAFVKFVSLQDEAEELFEHDGLGYRFKQISTKEWLTPFGVVQVDRRYFQRDVGGVGGDGVAPIDLRCGMRGRFMTPDVEEAIAFASANLSPTFTHALFAKVLPQAPSEKAIRRTIAELGQWADEAREEVEGRIAREGPFARWRALGGQRGRSDGSLEGAWLQDGSPSRASRRARRQQHGNGVERGVGTVSIYEPGDGAEELPQRVATKYFARMPESGMMTLFGELGETVFELQQERTYREVVIVCDGKPALWSTIENDPLYDNATQVLDFFHAVEHLTREGR